MDPPISLKSNLEFLSIYINRVLSENKTIRKAKKKKKTFKFSKKNKKEINHSNSLLFHLNKKMAKFPLGICLMFMITTSTIYEVQGHFLLDHYLTKIPKLSSEFEPFAFKGINSFIDHLEGLCPLKADYKDFFTKLKDFMAFINSASGSSSEFHSQLKTKSEELFKAITKMGGKAGPSVRVYVFVINNMNTFEYIRTCIFPL